MLKNKQFDSFRLGAVIKNVVSKGHIRKKLKEIFNGSANTYFTVGTIEPRKNHKYLLDAFDEVWKNCDSVNLCIVGRLGWFYDEFIKYAKACSEYNKKLFIFNDLSDTELDYCYSHSKALVFPSQAEGFGLPLVEALYKGLPVFVSDIPVFREVGRDYCTYFDLDNPDHLTDIITEIEKTGKMLEVRQLKECQLTTWEDCCRDLFIKVLTQVEENHN